MAPSEGKAARRVIIGTGWAMPAALAVLFVALIYVPAHIRAGVGIDAPIAAAATLYVLALSVAAPRLVRGAVLRAGGSRAPIVLLGTAHDATMASPVSTGWRLAAVALGTITSLVAAAVSMQLASGSDPTSYGHAVISAAAAVNLALAAGILVPAPGFSGWVVLLTIVDAAGARPSQRIGQAARLSRYARIVIVAAVSAAAMLFGDPILFVVGLILGLYMWATCRLAESQDATARFIAGHRAGDLARPATSRADPDEALDDLIDRLPAENTVTVIGPGAPLGAIGPRQIASYRATARGVRCRDVMVPLAELRPIASSAPAVELLPHMDRNGFALVWGVDGPAYVETDDLATQIRLWVWMQERRQRERTGRE